MITRYATWKCAEDGTVEARGFADSHELCVSARDHEAEVGRLRAALQMIATLKVDVSGHTVDPVEWMRDAARTALNSGVAP